MVRHRGFTLVETLIVVAIIVILAMALLPVCEEATKQAESSVCLTNLRGLANAASIYADDYDGRLVPAYAGGGASGGYVSWEALLLPYFRTARMLVCASDPLPNTTSGMVSYKHSYGINYEVACLGGYAGSALCLWDLPDPAGTILFFDLRGSLRTMGGSPDSGGLQFVDCRHANRANFVFAAGNAKRYRPETTLATQAGSASGNLWDP